MEQNWCGYEAAWKNVAAQLQSVDPDRIIAELKRQAFEQNPNVPAADAARTIVANASSDALFSSAPNIDTKQIANQIYGIERSDPSRAKAVEAEVMALLETGDQSRFANELKTIRGYVSQADAALAKLGVDAKAARAPEATTVKAEADRLLTEATVTAHTRIPRDAVIVSDIAYSLQKMAEANPKLAQAVRANLVQRLPPENSADLNRILAGDTSFGEGIIQAIEHPIDGGKGLGKGLANGFIFLGDIFVRGSTYQAAADIEQSAALQSLIGNNKDIAESGKLAQGLRDVAARPMIEQLPTHNIAQSGGADVGMAIDVATGVKAVATAAPKLLAKNADEIAEIASKHADELEPPSISASEEVRGVTSTANERRFPNGFGSFDAFNRFGKDLRDSLRQAGYPDTEITMQGSSVTGKSYDTGLPFDAGRVSDFDIALSGNPILQAAKDANISLRSGGTRTGPLTERDLRTLGLYDVVKQMNARAERPVNFMIYRSTEDAVKRNPSMIFPR